jgi:hypothetical protein
MAAASALRTELRLGSAQKQLVALSSLEHQSQARLLLMRSTSLLHVFLVHQGDRLEFCAQPAVTCKEEAGSHISCWYVMS